MRWVGLYNNVPCLLYTDHCSNLIWFESVETLSLQPLSSSIISTIISTIIFAAILFDLKALKRCHLKYSLLSIFGSLLLNRNCDYVFIFVKVPEYKWKCKTVTSKSTFSVLKLIQQRGILPIIKSVKKKIQMNFQIIFQMLPWGLLSVNEAAA